MPISQQFLVRTLAELTAHKAVGTPGRISPGTIAGWLLIGAGSHAADQ